MDLEICVRGGKGRQFASPSEGKAPNLVTVCDYLP